MIPHLVPKIEGGTLSVTEKKEEKKKKEKKDWSWRILEVGFMMISVVMMTNIFTMVIIL